jgi:hypothetical protein
MTRTGLVAFAAVAVLAGCSGGESPTLDASTPATSTGGPAPADFRATLSNKELMSHVIDNAADGVWLHQGWVDSAEGTEELFPTDEAGWMATRNAAATLAEASNLLLLPGRPADDDRAWVDYAHQLHDASIAAMKAADARDKEAFFNAGGDMYVACRSCHQRYVIGEMK